MHGRHNGTRTALLLGLMSALIMGVGSVFGSTGVLLALLVAIGLNGFAYWRSDTLSLRAMRARPVSEFEAPELYRVVRELSTAARRPMPRVYLSPTDAPNAFATGRSPRHATVCCTRGILRLLDERELRGVIAHELSHIHNRDILLASVAGCLASAVMLLVHLAWLLPFGRTEEDGPGLVELLLLAVLGPLAATVIRLAVSRSREYGADAAGARLTGDPLALASALRKLDVGTSRLPLPGEPRLRTASHLMIANPFGCTGRRGLFATHPPMKERIARLERMGS
ncbi:zinc metalloprotease HtpX [Streptomyces sp. P38-E01]|uniref:Protease HtpX homolog n=1 Tax=Streptomyces tardus TaxID=2780544 RepID=A0A949JE95_9ACTN|nr:zinc metalloprotease HtpX [Streptomyces tardus]MBU7596940.1 zinc metalloprotease HtpX [Streptomyces tardus]